MVAQRSVGRKAVVFRRASATGEILLTPATIRAIRNGSVDKGDVLKAAELAGLLAAKRTPELIPHCHPIPLTGISVDLVLGSRGVRASAIVEAYYRTGVEMEALVAVSVALLTVWDMVKYLEKNARGQYPHTRVRDVRVVAKEKRRRLSR